MNRPSSYANDVKRTIANHKTLLFQTGNSKQQRLRYVHLNQENGKILQRLQTLQNRHQRLIMTGRTGRTKSVTVLEHYLILIRHLMAIIMKEKRVVLSLMVRCIIIEGVRGGKR